MSTDNTKAFERALRDDPCAVDDRHERGCVMRYGAVPDGDSPYIKHPEFCPCHQRQTRDGVVYIPPGTFRVTRTIVLPVALWMRFVGWLRRIRQYFGAPSNGRE